MGVKICLLSLILMTVYLLIGSVIFWSIEHDLEVQNKKQVYDNYAKLQSQQCIDFGDFDDLLKLAWTMPPTFDPNKNSSDWQWDIAGSVFFSFVVISTIGFGNQYPQTMLGRIAVILYALLGLPIYSNTVYQMGQVGKSIINKLESYAPAHVKKYKYIIALVFVVFLFVIVFLVPAALLMGSESWTYHEALYFSFIALSTIGFGDYIAGVDKPGYYQILLVIWMLAGLVYVASVIAFIQHLFEEFSNVFSLKKINAGITKGKPDSGHSKNLKLRKHRHRKEVHVEPNEKNMLHLPHDKS